VLLAVQANGTNKFLVSGGGNVYATEGFNANSTEYGIGDVAEYINLIANEQVVAGDVLVVDKNSLNKYRKSTTAYAQHVAGVISDTGAFFIGARGKDRAPLALTGLVKVKVSTENGPIAVGDYLVTASEPGYAMRYDPLGGKSAGLVGMALEPLESGQDRIKILINKGLVIGQKPAGISLDSPKLTVVENNGQLVYVPGDLDLRGRDILNVANIKGVSDKWYINEEGYFVTRIETVAGTKEFYSVQSPAAEFVLSGSAKMVNGKAVVVFDSDIQEIIDPNVELKVTITLTSQASNGIYVSEKSAQGFTVRELNAGSHNGTFDWLVIATRKNSAAPVVEPEPQPEPDPPLAETPEPVVDPNLEPVIEPEPVVEPTPEPDPPLAETPEPVVDPNLEPVIEPEPVVEPTPEPDPPLAETPEPVVDPNPEPVIEPEPVPEPGV